MEEVILYLVGFIIVIMVAPVLIKKIFYWLRERRMLKKLSQSGMPDIDKMDGHQFEVYLKALLKELNYKSAVTSGSHDFGADLIMKKDGKKVSIQAKRYRYKNRVSLDAVQQVYASKPYYKTDECWIITNSMFTKSAIKLAEACGVKLYDRYALAELINRSKATVKPKDIKNTVTPEERKCPVCSGTLIQRKSKTGNQFMGCSNYPKCNYTEPVAK